MMVYDKIPEIECQNCGWSGYIDELLPADNKHYDYTLCPECASDEICDYED